MRYTVATQPESQDRPPIRLLQTKTAFFLFFGGVGGVSGLLAAGRLFAHVRPYFRCTVQSVAPDVFFFFFAGTAQ